MNYNRIKLFLSQQWGIPPHDLDIRFDAGDYSFEDVIESLLIATASNPLLAGYIETLFDANYDIKKLPEINRINTLIKDKENQIKEILIIPDPNNFARIEQLKKEIDTLIEKRNNL